MNQARLNRFVLPGEKVLKRPKGLPPFPVRDFAQATIMEKFLADDCNKAAVVRFTHVYNSAESYSLLCRDIIYLS